MQYSVFRKTIITISFILMLNTVYGILNTGNVFAENLESERYRIQFGDVNIGGENLKSSTYDLSVSLGQTAAEEFQSAGYSVKAGFQYLHSIIPFRFSISNSSVNLGTVLPNSPATEPITLTVSFGSAGEYQVTAQEEQPLATLTGNAIPDTICDGGVNTCSEGVAKSWVSSTAYGFGYNMAGDDIPADFSTGSHYRPFPDRGKNEPAAVVMTSSQVGRNRQSTVTFKVNVSAVQPAGSYQTIIRYTATPTY